MYPKDYLVTRARQAPTLLGLLCLVLCALSVGACDYRVLLSDLPDGVGAGGVPSQAMLGGGAGGGGQAGAAIRPSCSGLRRTCGPNRDADCCASSVVPGGTFFRSYDGVTYKDKSYPATVSAFELDTYEITVGRYERFYKSDPSQGFPCWGPYPADSKDDNQPMSCLDWDRAQAFCTWDGGRLPTEAEWNYAAAGGDEQRVYPWGNAAPDCTYANFLGGPAGTNGSPTFCTPTGVPVGVGASSPRGDGKWGQADLAGNIKEWVVDWYAVPYLTPCDNCAQLTPTQTRVLRGGSAGGEAKGLLVSARENQDLPFESGLVVGARCARSLP